MITRILFLALSLCLCINLSAQATERAKNRAKNRAENRANRKVDQKVDDAVDEAFDAIGSLFKKKNKKTETDIKSTDASTDATSPATGSGMFGGKWEPFTNDASFSVEMKMTEIKKNGKREQTNMHMAIVTDQIAVRIKDEDEKEVSHMILNTQTGKTTMITTDKNGQKTGMRMRMPGIGKAIDDQVEETMERFTFTATGERKTINGYDCEKVIVKDTKEGTVTESWITQDIGLNAQDVFGGMARMTGGKGPKKGPMNTAGMGKYMEGFPVMSTTTESNGKVYETHFSNIRTGTDIDKSLLDTSGVEIQSLGF